MFVLWQSFVNIWIVCFKVGHDVTDNGIMMVKNRIETNLLFTQMNTEAMQRFVDTKDL